MGGGPTAPLHFTLSDLQTSLEVKYQPQVASLLTATAPLD